MVYDKSMKFKLRLKLRLILYKNGKQVQSISMRVKEHLISSFQRAIDEKRCSSGLLRVNYMPDVYNEIDVKSADELKKALSVFTENQLVKYLQS